MTKDKRKSNIADDLFGTEPSKSIHQLRKGNLNERKVAKKFQKWVGAEFARVPRSGGLRWKNKADVSGDVMCTDPKVNFPFVVETKHYKKLNFKFRKNNIIFTFWKQVERDANNVNKIPLLVLKSNYMKDWVVITYEPKKDELPNPVFRGKGLVGWYFNDLINVDYKKFVSCLIK